MSSSTLFKKFFEAKSQFIKKPLKIVFIFKISIDFNMILTTESYT